MVIIYEGLILVLTVIINKQFVSTVIVIGIDIITQLRSLCFNL